MNKEQAEAHQAALDLKNEQMVADWPEEDRKKFQAVQKAGKIMDNAGVIYLMFPILKSPSGGGLNGAYQFNNAAKLYYDENEKMTPETQKNVNDVVSEFSSGFFNFLLTTVDQIRNSPDNQKFFHFVGWMQHAISSIYNKHVKK